LEFRCYIAYKLTYMLFYIHFRLQAAIFEFLLIPTNGSVYINSFVVLNIKNIYRYSRRNFVAIMYKQAKTYVLPYQIPVTGRHL